MCDSVRVGFIVEGSFSACEVVSYNNRTHQLQIGAIQTRGLGLGFPVASLGSGPLISNASSISQLGGPFAQFGGGGEVAGAGVGGDYFQGLPGQPGPFIWGVAGSIGPAIEAPGPFGAEVHGELTNTFTNVQANLHL